MITAFLLSFFLEAYFVLRVGELLRKNLANFRTPYSSSFPKLHLLTRRSYVRIALFCKKLLTFVLLTFFLNSFMEEDE